MAAGVLAFCISNIERQRSALPQPIIIDDYIPCNHGCQNKPFYRGSSRRIPFYHSGQFAVGESFRLSVEEANKEGGTIVIEDSVLLANGTYHFNSAQILIVYTVHDVSIIGNTLIHGDEQ